MKYLIDLMREAFGEDAPTRLRETHFFDALLHPVAWAFRKDGELSCLVSHPRGGVRVVIGPSENAEGELSMLRYLRPFQQPEAFIHHDPAVAGRCEEILARDRARLAAGSMVGEVDLAQDSYSANLALVVERGDLWSRTTRDKEFMAGTWSLLVKGFGTAGVDICSSSALKMLFLRPSSYGGPYASTDESWPGDSSLESVPVRGEAAAALMSQALMRAFDGVRPSRGSVRAMFQSDGDSCRLLFRHPGSGRISACVVKAKSKGRRRGLSVGLGYEVSDTDVTLLHDKFAQCVFRSDVDDKERALITDTVSCLSVAKCIGDINKA